MKSFTAIFILAGLASANVFVDKRTCAADNCIRALRSRSVQASTDCAALLQSTSTITITPARSTVYSTVTTATSLVTTTQITTTTLTQGPPMQKKVLPTPGVPTYASACSNAAGFSSACSCIGAGAKTTTISTTLATPTTTILVTSTSILVVTDSSTTTTITTITDVPTPPSTPTTTLPPPPPTASPETCTAFPLANGGQLSQYYTGYGYSEDFDNPGETDPMTGPLGTNLPNVGSDCDILSECVDFAQTQYAMQHGDGTLVGSFELYYSINGDHWACIVFGGPNTDGAYFDLQDPDVGRVYGYST